MATITKDLGTATAYGYAKDNGYEGTEQEFGELMASYATVADEAQACVDEAERQVGLAQEQVTLATAQAQASASSATEASGYADDASASASASASSATDSATSATASETAKTQAQGYAQDAGGSASNALTYKNQAQAYASNAESSANSASASANTASDKADIATTKASEASASASSASDSADSASASASAISASLAQIEENKEDIAVISALVNKYDDLQEIHKVTSSATTLGDIATFLNTVNTAGDHVFFDVSALGAQMYLCTIFIDTTENVYKIFDLVKGRVAEGTYDASMLLTMAIAMASNVATQSQIDYLQGEIDELGGKSVIENWDALAEMIANGTSTDVISAGDIIPVNWIKTVLGTTTNGLTVTCSDADKFINGVGEAEAKTYLFVYNGSSWTYEGEVITLADFGLSVSGTPVTGEVMTIVTTVDEVDYTFTSYDTINPVDASVEHNWCLEQTYAPSTKAYDTYESLFCLKEGKTLSAGKYYLPMHSYRSSADFNICFTLPSAVSGKAQFSRSASGSADTIDVNGTNKSGVYRCTSMTPLSYGTTTTLTTQIAITYLSTADAQAQGYTLLPSDSIVAGNFDCCALGDNSWEYSNIRQWLNDDTLADNFVPAHDNDIANAYNRGAGFLWGIDPRAKKYIQEAEVLWVAGYGNVSDFPQGQLQTSHDKVFLLSMKEMSFNIQTTEGEITTLYGEYTNDTLTNDAVASRAKYNKTGGTLNSYRWSRSAFSSYAFYSWVVSSTGAGNGSYAIGAFFYAPAFIVGKSVNQ